MSNADKPFHNDLVVVTGAGSGIGRATALAFAANGARLVAADINLAAATSVCELIRERNGEAHAHQVDVADAAGPGFTSTSIARSARLVGVPEAEQERVHERLAKALRRRRFPPHKVARAVLLAVLRDRPVVPVNAEAKITYALSLAAPRTLRALARQGARRSPLRPHS